MFYVTTTLLTMGVLAIVYFWAVSSFPRLAQRRRAVMGALAALVVLGQATGQATIHWHLGSRLHAACGVVTMTLAFAALPMGAMRTLFVVFGRLRRRAMPLRSGKVASHPSEGYAPAAPSGAAPTRGMTRRQVVEAASGLSFLATSGSMLGWGMVVGRHGYRIDEVAVRIVGLPRALDGYVIAQVSDLHAGMYVGERQLDEGLALVRRARPDLLVITGDIVDFDPSYAPLVARKLVDVAPSRDGLVAILGNHDYYAGAGAVRNALRAARIPTLVNEGRVIRQADGGGFALLGADDLRAQRFGGRGPDLARALSGVPHDIPRILLSHQPPTVDRWAGQVALQLSGHTHGGQINPGFRPADFLMPYVAGKYSVGDTVLYVNRGFGTVGPPARVGAPPEVTRVVLVAA